jgi:hypothetical protein
MDKPDAVNTPSHRRLENCCRRFHIFACHAIERASVVRCWLDVIDRMIEYARAREIRWIAKIDRLFANSGAPMRTVVRDRFSKGPSKSAAVFGLKKFCVSLAKLSIFSELVSLARRFGEKSNLSRQAVR